MQYWLVKSEPSTYSWQQFLKDKKTTWDGVTSPGGLHQIKLIKKGDKAFIYHTGDEKQVVGIGEEWYLNEQLVTCIDHSKGVAQANAGERIIA